MSGIVFKNITLLDRTKTPGKTEAEKKKNEIKKKVASTWAKRGGYKVMFLDGTSSDDYELGGGSGSSDGGYSDRSRH